MAQRSQQQGKETTTEEATKANNKDSSQQRLHSLSSSTVPIIIIIIIIIINIIKSNSQVAKFIVVKYLESISVMTCPLLWCMSTHCIWCNSVLICVACPNHTYRHDCTPILPCEICFAVDCRWLVTLFDQSSPRQMWENLEHQFVGNHHQYRCRLMLHNANRHDCFDCSLHLSWWSVMSSRCPESVLWHCQPNPHSLSVRYRSISQPNQLVFAWSCSIYLSVGDFVVVVVTPRDHQATNECRSCHEVSVKGTPPIGWVWVIDAMCLGCWYLAIALLLPILVSRLFRLVSCLDSTTYDMQAMVGQHCMLLPTTDTSK